MSSSIHEKSALFRAVSEEVRVESALFRDFRVVYSAESELKLRWSALIISESEVISPEILWDLNPGSYLNAARRQNSTVIFSGPWHLSKFCLKNNSVRIEILFQKFGVDAIF